MVKKEKQNIETNSEITVESATATPEVSSKVTPKAPTKKTATKKTTTKKTKTTKTDSKATKEGVKEVIKEVVKIVTPEVYLQFAGMEFNSSGILNQARQAWIATGHDENSITSLKVYIKPEDAAAYYVINETETGKIDL